MRRALVLFVAVIASSMTQAKERTFELTYDAELDVPEGTSRIQMWIPYPSRSEDQDVRLVGIDSSVPTKVYQEYVYRNSMLFLSTSVGELDRIRVEMKFRVTRRERVEKDFIQLEDPDGYMESSARQWLLGDSLGLADEATLDRAIALTENLDLVSEKARALYDEAVVAEEPESPDAVFIAMARAVGMPAKSSLGFELPGARGEDGIDGYRFWGEFYLPGYGWVPVDPTAARRKPEMADYFFGAHDENRVVITQGRNIELNPRQQGDPLTFFIYPYAEADGAVVEDIRSHISFKDLGEAP